MSWIGAGATVVSAGIGAVSKANSKSTREPQHLVDAEKTALEKATNIANRPYQKYEQERVAGLSQNERSALELASTGNEQVRRTFDEAGNLIGDAADMDYQRDVQGYMNPYIESALDPQIRRQNEAYDRQRAALLNSKAGAFGGDRVAIESSMLEKNLRDSVADLTSRTYSEAFDRAQQAFFADSDRKLKAAQALQSVGNDVSQLNREDIQNLMATGGTERLLRQAQLDVNYDAFREARDWDVTNLDPLLKAISASKGGNTTTTDGKTGAVGQILGAGLAAGAMYFIGRAGGKGKDDSGGGSGGLSPDEALRLALS